MSLFKGANMPDLKESSDTTAVRKLGLDLLAKINQVYDLLTNSLSANGVYDTGSNTNGYWIRYTNGVMQCWVTLQLGTNDQTWTFPIAFTSSPSVTATGTTAGTGGWMTTTYGLSSTSVTVVVRTSGGAVTTMDRCAMALGRWK